MIRVVALGVYVVFFCCITVGLVLIVGGRIVDLGYGGYYM